MTGETVLQEAPLIELIELIEFLPQDEVVLFGVLMVILHALLLSKILIQSHQSQSDNGLSYALLKRRCVGLFSRRSGCQGMCVCSECQSHLSTLRRLVCRRILRCLCYLHCLHLVV